jgi:hypothetical protein
VAKRSKKNRRADDDEVLRLEPQPDREVQREWTGLFVPYIYCAHCKHVYSANELNKYDWDEPLPLPTVDEEGKPEGAQDLALTCRICRKARLLRVVVDFGAVEPYRLGGKRAKELGAEIFLCNCPLCGSPCRVQRSRGLRVDEHWGCGTCDLSLHRAWM